MRAVARPYSQDITVRQIHRSVGWIVVVSLLWLSSVSVGCHRNAAVPSTGAPDSANVFAPRQAAPDGSTTRFTPLSPTESGIDFIVKWDKPAEYDRVFFSLNTGGGVTVGDYDGDGLADIFFTRPSGGPRLYRNLGGLKFSDVTEVVGLRDDQFWATGASFVDIDNDGDLDLYACSFADENRLYLNESGMFLREAGALGLNFRGASVMMSFADYDRDGDLDGYLVTGGLPPGPEHAFRVKFVKEGSVEKPVIPAEIEEYWKMLYLPGNRARQVEAGQFDRVFRNDGKDASGKPKFVEVHERAGIRDADIGQAAIWWDYNDDGWPDIYVANDYWGPDHLYRNNQDGTFTDVNREALPHTPWSSMGVDIGDLNRDGQLDLMATDMAGSNHFRQKVGMGDMAKSGWFLEYGEPRQYNRNAVLINSGTDRFLEAAFLTQLDASDWTWSPRFDDYDNDGFEDVLITNGMTRDFTNSDINEVAKQQFKEGTPEFFAFWRRQGMRRDRNLMLRNRGDLQFEDVGHAWGFEHVGVSFGAATADFDLDGDLDLVLNNMDIPAQVYRNNSLDGRSLRLRLVGSQSNRSGWGAKVRAEAGAISQVRYLTSTRGWSSTSEPIVHFGVGDTPEVDRVTIRWPSGITQELQHLSTDRLHVIQEPPTSSASMAKREQMANKPTTSADSSLLGLHFEPFVAWQQVAGSQEETPFDDYAVQQLLPYKLSQLGPGIACGDINGDGRDDYYLGGAAGKTKRLLVSRDGGFAEQSVRAFAEDQACEDMGAVFLDADRDGDLDLYVVSGSSELPADHAAQQDRLYRQERGTFVRDATAIPDTGSAGSVVAAADFDRDGDLDLFVGGRGRPGEYPLPSRSYLLRNDDGRFVDVTNGVAPDLAEPGMVTSATWVDSHGDAFPELWITVEWGAVQAFHNEQGQKLSDATEASGLKSRSGWWNGLRSADLDNDGDIDIVATNCGLNTKYHASVEHPALIYYGDLDGSGTSQIVESEYEDDKLFPVRGKSCSTRAMPSLAQRFPTFTAFGSAELTEIYQPDRLKAAHKFEANTLESGIWRNDGQGKFTFEPLPRIAQIAPSFGIELIDANADGWLDLYLVQNFYSPQRETGRMDGGVSMLLLNQPHDRTWRPVGPKESGLVVGGDAKSVAVTDLDGDDLPDMIVGINDGPWRAFRGVASSDRHWLRVDLQGPPGNPQAIGTRLVINGQGGSHQSRDIQAGAGYLSQASSSQWFGLVAQAHDQINLQVIWSHGATTTHDVRLDPARSVTRIELDSPAP